MYWNASFVYRMNHYATAQCYMSINEIHMYIAPCIIVIFEK